MLFDYLVSVKIYLIIYYDGNEDGIWHTSSSERPLSLHCVATLLRFSRFLAASDNLAPLSAKYSAVTAPIPALAPAQRIEQLFFFSLSIFYFHIKMGERIGQKFNNINCALSFNSLLLKYSSFYY